MNNIVTSQRYELPNLDLLRAVAVMLVFADHVLETIGHQVDCSFHPYDWYMGRLGVLIFFVHTSLVLMRSMERLQLRGWALVKSFYIRRAFRIYPLSILCVVAVITFGIPALPWETFSLPPPRALASNLLLTMNLTNSEPVLAPMWSLPLEMQMYFLLPSVFLFLRSGTSKGKFVALYAFSLLCAWLLPMVSSRLSAAFFAPCFMAGILAYSLQQRERETISGHLWPLFIGTIIIVYIAVEELTLGIHHSLLQWLVCLVLGLMIPYFRQISVRPINLVAQTLAKYSYGIYLFHCIALWFGCFWLDFPMPIQWIVVIATLIALSILSFHILEQPAIKFGARLAQKSTHIAA